MRPRVNVSAWRRWCAMRARASSLSSVSLLGVVGVRYPLQCFRFCLDDSCMSLPIEQQDRVQLCRPRLTAVKFLSSICRAPRDVSSPSIEVSPGKVCAGAGATMTGKYIEVFIRTHWNEKSGWQNDRAEADYVRSVVLVLFFFFFLCINIYIYNTLNLTKTI